MRAFTVLTTFVAVPLASVLATPGATPGALITRQVPNISQIPPKCQSACATAQKVINCGTNMECSCTRQNVQAMIDCQTCGFDDLKNDPTINSLKPVIQSGANALTDACKSTGHDIGTFDVLGAGGGSAPATSASGTTPAGKPSLPSSNGATSMSVGGALTGFIAAVGFLVV